MWGLSSQRGVTDEVGCYLATPCYEVQRLPPGAQRIITTKED